MDCPLGQCLFSAFSRCLRPQRAKIHSTYFCVAGGFASFQRPDADLQYLSLVAGSALEREPASLLLLVSPTDAQTASKGQGGVFLVAGPSGDDAPVPVQLSYCLLCGARVNQAFPFRLSS